MTLDIKGGLKNTTISSNRYVVIEELLSNAIDSYLIRKKSEEEIPSLSISFEIEFSQKALFEDSGYDMKISCLDNGAGFDNDQIRAFVTKDSTYKDHLNIQGIGRCKGTGRIQFFHFFRMLKIESAFIVNGKYEYKVLNVDENTREVTETDFKSLNDVKENLQTCVILAQVTDEAYRKHFDPKAIRRDFSAKSIRDHIVVSFLQRLIILKGIVGDFLISVKEKEGENLKTELVNSSDLPSPVSREIISIICAHGSGSENPEPKKDLIVTRYSLPETTFGNAEHEVALCANSALVLSLTKYYLRGALDRKKAIDGNFELLLVEGELLEGKVNEQRDGFKIPKDCTLNGELYGDVSLQDIIESLEDYVFDILTPKDFDKDKLIEATQERFGISKSMLNGSNIKIHYNDSEENIAKRVLKKYQEEIVKETSDIFNLKQALLKLDPRSSDFREKIGELSWKYTATIKKVDMANLSQLIVRRSSMLEVLEKAVDIMLECQNESECRKENEKIIHNLFFPTGKDSNDTTDHDIWILNEEYHYFEHIASDKSLAKIPWNEKEKLFDDDIDSSLEALFSKNNKDHQRKRPDIAIFNQEGAAIIIEFKAPGVELQEHIPDLVQYARLLAAKSNGRLKKFYGYLIGDCMDETRMLPNYKRFPSGLGYFNTDPITNPATGMIYGELYTEVLFYKQFISKAKNRLKVFREKLNVIF